MVCQKLNSFINKYPKKEDGKHTHIIYAPSPGKSCTIPDDKIDEFYSLVHNSIFIKGDKLSIVEKIQNRSRLVIDLDFKYKEKLNNRQYNEEILEESQLKISFLILKHFMKVSEEQKICWIMEKDHICNAPQNGYESKDGIHFLFPFIIAEKTTYRKLRELIIECDYHDIFKKK